MFPINGSNDTSEVPSIPEAQGYFFPAIRCGGTNQDLVEDGLVYFQDEDAYGVESNRLVTVASSQVSEGHGKFSPGGKALLEKVSCGPTRCSSSMKISGSTLRKFLKLL